jgi:hypothetical protein
MNYSTATADLAIGSALFVLPHLLIGLASLYAGYSGKVFFKQGNIASNRMIHFLFGVIFAGAAGYSIAKNITETYSCRNAEKFLNHKTIQGEIEVTYRFKKAGYGYVEFKIGDSSFTTYESGLSCDCGYITPLGKKLTIESGMLVEAKISDRRIISLNVVSKPEAR